MAAAPGMPTRPAAMLMRCLDAAMERAREATLSSLAALLPAAEPASAMAMDMRAEEPGLGSIEVRPLIKAAAAGDRLLCAGDASGEPAPEADPPRSGEPAEAAAATMLARWKGSGRAEAGAASPAGDSGASDAADAPAAEPDENGSGPMTEPRAGVGASLASASLAVGLDGDCAGCTTKGGC